MVGWTWLKISILVSEQLFQSFIFLLNLLLIQFKEIFIEV